MVQLKFYFSRDTIYYKNRLRVASVQGWTLIATVRASIHMWALTVTVKVGIKDSALIFKWISRFWLYSYGESGYPGLGYIVMVKVGIQV